MTDQITALGPVVGGRQPTGGSGSQTDAAALSSDFETFLKMLTVQVRNQDPLNPVDSTDYATQLATFSSVEQQVKTNDLLRLMADQLGGGLLNQVSQWIGKEALVRAPVWFDQSGPVAIRPDYAAGADSAVLVVRDGTGAVIEKFTISVGEETAVWAGTTAAGALHPAGIYRFEIESYQGETLLGTQGAAVYSRIEEVRSDGGAVLVRLSDGTELPSTMITGLRGA